MTLRSSIFTAFCAVSFCLSLNAQVPNYVPNNGLLGWWDFTNGLGTDALGTNNFTNFGAVAAADRNGTANAAAGFNGSTQYMQVASPTFTLGQASNFSISMWMYRPAQGYGVAIMHGTTTNGNFIWNFQTNTTNGIQFGTNKQGSAWTWAQNTYTAGTWTHLVATYQGGSMTLYVNGVQAATASYPHTGAVQTTLPLWLGRGVGGANFLGSLDDLGMWNRVLTLAEIQGLYASCSIQVTSQPSSQKSTVGGSAQFACTASSPSASFQWQELQGSTWSNLANSAPYSGAQNSTLTISPLSPSLHNRSYRCIVAAGSTCSDTSDAASLEVCGTITVQPTDSTTTISNGASFTTASSDPGALFTWIVNLGSGFQPASAQGNASGTQSPTMVLTNLGMNWNNAKVRCIVESGSCTDTTSEATLTVINNIGLAESDQAAMPFPNPSSNMLHWHQAWSHDVTVRIWTTHGQLAAEKLLRPGDQSWSYPQQPTGYYVLEVGGRFYPWLIQ